MLFKNSWFITTACVSVVGCTSPEDGARLGVGSGGAVSLGSGGTTASNSGGSKANNLGGSPAASGGLPATSGGTGAGGNPSQASGGAAVGGSHSASGGNAVGSGGANGTGAASGALAFAAGLNYRVEVPCLEPGDAELCPAAMTLPPHIVAFGGDPQTSYTVTLRIRGVTEPHTFSNLNDQPITTVTPAPYFLDSSQGRPDDIPYALYSIEVTQPQKTYYANAFHSIDGDFHHRLFALDYTADITVQGGASVTLRYADGNNEQVKNFGNLVVPEIPPAPLAFDGQFLQIDVISAQPSP